MRVLVVLRLVSGAVTSADRFAAIVSTEITTSTTGTAAADSAIVFTVVSDAPSF